MNNTKSSILITLFVCTGQGKNHYTVVSIKKIRSLLKIHHNITVGRRWIFQCVKDLLIAGLITRKQRFTYNSEELLRQLPSMVSFTIKGARHLYSKHVGGAIKLLKSLLKYVTGSDKRWPQEEDITPTVELKGKKRNQRELTKLLDLITGTAKKFSSYIF